MKHHIEKEFTFKELLEFAFPTMIMMIFMSLYTIVDGFFVSRFVGAEALSAVNIVYPLISINIAVGVMFATGGSAVVAWTMGQGKEHQAKRYFTGLVIVAFVLSVIIAVLVLCNMDRLIEWLGAEGELKQYCKDYLWIMMLYSPVSTLQLMFQDFLVVASRPHLGLGLSIGSGIFNMAFDYLLIAVFHMGVQGAAYATVGGYFVSAIGGILFFLFHKKGLKFTKPAFPIKMILKSCANGSSEMVTNLSTSITTALFNFYMLQFAGANGVASITTVLYCQFLMTSIFIGFSIGVAPVISYHYGAQNQTFLRKVLKWCVQFILVCSVAMWLLSLLGADFVAKVFFTSGTEAYSLAAHGLRLFGVSFLFAGINIFGSAVFTALGNGLISAGISFSRTLGFTVIGIVGMSYIWGMDGLWFAVPFAELVTIFVVIICARKLKTQYHIF